MTALGAPLVRHASIRVALTTTVVVAAAYVVIAIAVVALVTRDLTSQVDHRLVSALHDPHQTGAGPGLSDGDYEGPPPDRRFPTLLAWIIESDGHVFTDPSNPALPAAYEAVTDPTTATIEGTPIRLVGATYGEDHVVLGQALTSVSVAQSTIILAEIVIAPVLLVVVFLGAVAIGRRVATPIEVARRRQLEFTADASHELRTPLAVVEANASLALAQDRTNDWYRTAFGRVDLESKRMRRLLDDMLWLARFDAAQSPPNSEPVDLGVLAAQTADRFGAIAETRHLRLGVRAAPEGAIVSAPPELLDRLVGVLLDNACKYAPEGGLVEVAVALEGNRVQLIVDDSGPGIPEAERERIFDRFHRATDAAAGAGLGLAIADAIVRATGGRWLVGRAPAGGARMAVSWPRSLSGRSDHARDRQAARTPATD